MRNRLFGLIMAVCILPLLAAVQASAADMAKSGSMEQVVTSTNTLASNTETSRFIWSGNKLRIEHYRLDGLIVEIQEGLTHYIYQPSSKSAVKMVLPTENAMSVQEQLASMAKPVKGWKKIGTETMSGFKCDIYQFVEKDRIAKFYVSTDSRLPLKMKTDIRIGNIGQTTVIKNVKLNYEVADNLFVIPAGTKIKEKKVELPSAENTNKTGAK